MKRFWPGWLLCALTAVLFLYMAAFQAPGISSQIDGMKLPDVVVLGYDLEGARALHAAFKAQQAAADADGEMSAAATYLSMHQGSDLLFPPMLAASLAFLGFAGLRASSAGVGGRIGFRMVCALALVYMGFDYLENAVADTMFGPAALESDLNTELVPVLRGLTIGKYLAIAIAFIAIAAIWIGHLKRGGDRFTPL
ncbi:hypothetical protein [Hoeflea sp.]|uniref:hypothetical protein n=1 Tax=Hoeflea sp. TaxID=1940281 RepID=UPI00374907E6